MVPVEQGNLDICTMAHLGDTPTTETDLSLPSGSKWGGLRDPGTPPMAPALADAVFDVTGQPVRPRPFDGTQQTSRTGSTE